MKNRFLWLIVLVFMSLAVPLQANAQPYYEGIDYRRVEPPQPTDTGRKIQVVEMFWYGCPHCFHFEPYLNRWLKTLPKNVKFERMPATLNPSWVILARAYYTEQALGVVDKLHDTLFDAIHVKGRDLNSEQSLAAFFARHGVPAAKFRQAFDSFTVATDLKRAEIMTQRYGISGVPSIIVDGKYRTNAELAGGSFDRLLKIVDFLIGKVSKEKAQHGG